LNWDKFFFNSEIVSIIKKISLHNTFENSDLKINAAATVSEAYKVKESIIDSFECKGTKKIINSGTIDPYTSYWGLKKMQYIKDKYLYPRIKNIDLAEINDNRLKQSNESKVIIANMTKNLEAFIDIDGDYLAAKSTTLIFGNLNKLIFATALLNSKLIAFYTYHCFHTLKMQGGALNISSDVIKSIPFGNFHENDLIEINKKTLKLLSTKVDKEKTILIKQIDNNINKLFGLNYKEIDLINNFKL
jgi:hypothetical protein